MAASERKLWHKSTHESRVEGFYGVGAERFHEYHDGYLNFGLWDEGIREFVPAAENLVRHVGELAALDQQSRVLDVACGMGTQDVYLLNNFAPARIDGLDVTWKHVEQGRRRMQAAGFSEERAQFHHGTATALPFPDNTFSHLLGIEGPVHFDTRETFMREAHRVLRPGGTIVLSDYSLSREPRTLIEKLFMEFTCRLWNVPRENRDSVESYHEKMERSGFVEVEFEEAGERVIPGYYFEQRRPETIRELTRLRGFVAGRLGGVIDVCLYKTYLRGLIDYIFVRARKAA
jgi:microcystin synthetase protein McyJ